MAGRARPESGTDTPATSAVFRERAISLVPEQEVRHGVVGHEHVEPPVVIEVGNRGAHALAGVRMHAGLGRHVFERAVAAIAIQAVRQPLE